MGDEDFEQTLFVCRECYCYKLPPRPAATAYKCSDWGLDKPMWTGRCRVLSKGQQCTILLEDNNTGDVFGTCPVGEDRSKSVEAVSDSSRYFVIRIVNGTQHAFIGIGFAQRSESFDFNVAIQDHQKVASAEKTLSSGNSIIQESNKDYSLQSGQSISINTSFLKKKKEGQDGAGAAGGGASSGSSSSSTTTGGGGGGGGFGLLPPPGKK